MNKIRLAVILSLTIIVICSCHSKMSPAETTVDPDKILFLAYELKRDSVSGLITTKLLYQRTVDGSIKPASIEHAANREGNWQVFLVGKRGVTIDSLTIENPLHKRLEYVNEDGSMGIREVWLSRVELALRFNYKKEMNIVAIKAISPDKRGAIFSHALSLKE